MEQFIDDIKKLYYKYPTLIKILDNSNEEYKYFLYLHLTDNIKFKIKLIDEKNTIKNFLYKIKVTPNKRYSPSLTTIYHSHLNTEETYLINKGLPFEVTFYEESWGEKGSQDYFIYKNRRDFLIPCFFNKNTIKFLERVTVNDISSYKKLNKNFFITLAKIRELIKTNERIGIMVDGSCTLSIHNVRENQDVDLIIFHPRFYEPDIKEMIIDQFHKKLEFIDPYFHDFLEWEGEEKPILDYQITTITKNKYTDFNYLVFDPDYSYYFFGIKIVDLDYNLAYRAFRAYPKNIADLIITKHRLKIDVPKIKKLEENMFINKEKWYTKTKFIKTVNFYLLKFNFNKDFPHYNLLKEINEIEIENKNDDMIYTTDTTDTVSQSGGKNKYLVYKRYV